MKRELKKEVLKLYKKKDFKGIQQILNLNNGHTRKDYIENIYNNLTNVSYLKNYPHLIKKHFMMQLENF